MSNALFRESLDQCATYPDNQPTSLVRAHHRDAARTQLQLRASSLFDAGSKALIRCHDVYRTDSGPWRIAKPTLKTTESLRNHLNSGLETHDSEPICRHVHISAPNARKELYSTQEMFLLLMSYYQVNPRFLDFVFPFGKQSSRRDPHSGGFYSSTSFADAHAQPGSMRPGRSPCRLEFCFTLQAPEPARNDEQKWSVRQLSVWHELDLTNCKQVSIMIKANNTAWNEVQQRAAQHYTAQRPDDEDTLKTVLEASLQDHLDMLNWSLDYWQEYITSLEEDAKNDQKPMLQYNYSLITHKTSIPLNGITQSETHQSQHSGTTSQPTNIVKIAASFCKSLFTRPSLDETADLEMGDVKEAGQTEEEQMPPFSPRHLRQVSELQEAANTARLNLSANAAAVRGLAMEYDRLLHRQPVPTSRSVIELLESFRSKTADILLMIDFLLLRMDAYINVLRERTALMETALQCQLSIESREAAKRMEQMNRHMHREAIRMRLITFVTVLFLPATFASTFLSTTIFTFPDGTDGVWDTSLYDTITGIGALEIFLILSLPVMVIMFLSWRFMEWRIKVTNATASTLARSKAIDASVGKSAHSAAAIA